MRDPDCGSDRVDGWLPASRSGRHRPATALCAAKEPDDHGTALLYIDRQLVHEVTSPQAFEGLRLAGRRPWRAGANLATPDKCGVCHNADDVVDGNPYTGSGHGQTTIQNGTIGCTDCHDSAVAHSFSADGDPGNPIRFAFAEDTSVQLPTAPRGPSIGSRSRSCRHSKNAKLW